MLVFHPSNWVFYLNVSGHLASKPSHEISRRFGLRPRENRLSEGISAFHVAW